MSASVRTALAVLLLVATGARALWFLEFFILSISRKRFGFIRQLSSDMLLPESIRGNADQQLARYSLFFTHQVAAFTLGGLALTAWTVLITTNTTLDKNGRFTVAMLGIAVAISLGSAVLYRVAGGEFTRMGYESSLALAGLALVFGMATLLLHTFESNWLQWFIIVGGCVLVLRDVVDSLRQMQLTAGILPRSRDGAPPAEAAAGPGA